MSHFIDSMKWRYATKQFDPSKDITEEQLSELLEATRLSASSFGLQPFKVLVIKDRAFREQLIPFSFNQRQVADSSYLLVFCANLNIDEAYVNNFVEMTARERGMQVEQLAEYAGMMNNYVAALDADSKLLWSTKQTYLAHGNALAAAAHMQIDSCPMEGFDSAKYDEILGLKEKGLKSLVLMPVGYRSEEDGYQHLPKVRYTEEELFIHM